MSSSYRGQPEPGENDAAQPFADAEFEETLTPPVGQRFESLSKRQSQTGLTSEPAQVDVGKRLVASLLDVLVGYFLELIVNCIPLVNVFVHDQLPLVAFLIIRDALFNGRGIGKNLMGLQVVDRLSGRPASFRQSITRNLVVFGPYLVLYVVNSLLRFAPPEAFTLVSSIVTGLGGAYMLAVLPYEAWRVYSRTDGMRWGDQIAGTTIVPADMDFSNPLSK
jgi:hypothetical protein